MRRRHSEQYLGVVSYGMSLAFFIHVLLELISIPERRALQVAHLVFCRNSFKIVLIFSKNFLIYHGLEEPRVASWF